MRGIHGEFVLWKLSSFFVKKPPKSPPRFFSLCTPFTSGDVIALEVTGRTEEYTCWVTTRPATQQGLWPLSSTPYPYLMLPLRRPRGMCTFGSNSRPPPSVLSAANNEVIKPNGFVVA